MIREAADVGGSAVIAEFAMELGVLDLVGDGDGDCAGDSGCVIK